MVKGLAGLFLKHLFYRSLMPKSIVKLTSFGVFLFTLDTNLWWPVGLWYRDRENSR